MPARSPLHETSGADREQRLWHLIQPAVHLRGYPPGLEEAVRREIRAPYSTKADYFERMRRVLGPFPKI